MDSEMKLVREFVALEHARREHEKALKVIQKKMAQLQPHVAEFMGAFNMDKLTLDGYTVFPSRNRYIRRRENISTDDVAQTLRDMDDWSYLVRESYNASSLRSAVLEVLDSGADLPSQLLSVIEVEEVASIRFRESG